MEPNNSHTNEGLPPFTGLAVNVTVESEHNSVLGVWVTVSDAGSGSSTLNACVT